MRDEDLHLEAALQRSDELVNASLRREEDERRWRSKRALWVTAVIASFGVGIAVGVGASYWWISRARGFPAAAVANNSGVAATSNTSSKSEPIVITDVIPTEGPVEVKWGSRWLRGKIIEREGDIFLIKYDDWDDFFNEWVTHDRMRAIGSTRDTGHARPTPHGQKPGQPRERGKNATTTNSSATTSPIE